MAATGPQNDTAALQSQSQCGPLLLAAVLSTVLITFFKLPYGI